MIGRSSGAGDTGDKTWRTWDFVFNVLGVRRVFVEVRGYRNTPGILIPGKLYMRLERASY